MRPCSQKCPHVRGAFAGHSRSFGGRGAFKGIRGHSRAFARLGGLLAKLVRCNVLQAYRSHAYVKRTHGVGWAGRRGKEERTRKSSEQSPIIIRILWRVGVWVGWGVWVDSRILGGGGSFNTCSCCPQGANVKRKLSPVCRGTPFGNPRQCWEGGVNVGEGGGRQMSSMNSKLQATRLKTRLLREVWFPRTPLPRFLASLFTSLFAGEREAACTRAAPVAACGGTDKN